LNVEPGACQPGRRVPFDSRHERLYVALVAGLTGLGLTPRCVLEIPPTLNRLSRLIQLIQACGSSIHDLSRIQLDSKRPRCPRFNMPFEAGLAVAWAHMPSVEHHWFVFESVSYRLQKSLSDLNGIDPFIHNGTVEGICSALTRAFYREGVTAHDLVKKYRKLRPLAQQLKREGHTKDLFNLAGFRGLVLASQKIALVDRGIAT
jgi:hypothetical protein